MDGSSSTLPTTPTPSLFLPAPDPSFFPINREQFILLVPNEVGSILFPFYRKH